MKRLVLFSCLILTAPFASATQWHVLGPRAMGMGGAYVALAQGPAASYWNPAGLGQLYNYSGLEIPVSFNGEFTGSVLEGANNLYQLKQDCDAAGQAAGGNCQTSRINAALALLGQNGNGAQVDLGGALGFKIKRLVLFAQNLTYIGAIPAVDLANTAPATVANNQSKLITRGGSFTELGAGYAHEIKETGLVLGANLKGIIGKIGYNEILIVQNDPGAGSFNKFKDNAKTTIQPGVDVGLLWDIRETFPAVPMRPRFGLAGRNLNAPSFKQPAQAAAAGEAKHKLHGQARAGVALSPFKFWHLTADMDLTENLTLIDGRKSRMAGAGTEINVFNQTWLNIPLRAGIQKNLSKDSDTGAVLTGGAGLNFLHVMVDLAGSFSLKQTTLQSEGETVKVPRNVGVAARFAFLFGGKDEGARDSK